MNKPTLIKSIVALSVAALFAACSTDDEPQMSAKTYHGSLASLDSVPDNTMSRPQWRLLVDTVSGEELIGTCKWKGYLGDSAQVGGQSAAPGLYTNQWMSGTKTAQDIRAEGVILSMDTISQADTLTHYRVDFNCKT